MLESICTTTAAAAADHGPLSRDFKLIMLGDGGVGKTSLVKRHATDEFDTRYIPTVGVDVVPLTFNTQHQCVFFNCWDTGGSEKYGGMRDGYYLGSDAAIIVFDITSRVSYREIPNWHRDVSHTTWTRVR